MSSFLSCWVLLPGWKDRVWMCQQMPVYSEDTGCWWALLCPLTPLLPTGCNKPSWQQECPLFLVSSGYLVRCVTLRGTFLLTHSALSWEGGHLGFAFVQTLPTKTNHSTSTGPVPCCPLPGAGRRWLHLRTHTAGVLSVPATGPVAGWGL